MAARALPALDRRPQARAETVEDLVRQAREGRIRIPEFQRPLKWNARQVVDLFDSIYRGYPIGSILLFKRHAPAARVRLGPLTVDAPELPEAWWVADGQQRLTSLAASFARPDPYPDAPIDPFAVYFDAEEHVFKSPPRDGSIPDSWVPVPLLLDATKLSEWVFSWARQRELRSAAFEAGKRLREYQVPLYLIDSDDPELLSEIFARINTSGKPMAWSEVHDALYGHASPEPSTTTQLAARLGEVGMGRMGGAEVTSCLLAIRGLDVTRNLAEHRRRQPDVLANAVADALPVLRQVLSFLRDHARVPHLRLLPRTFVMEALARFFTVHPEPRPRSVDLLTRWVWRVFLNEGVISERTLRRRSIAAVTDDEEASVQSLLRLVPYARAAVSLPERFDARAAQTRLALLALADLGPRSFEDGHPIDVAAVLEERGAEAFRPIIPVRPGGPRGLRAPANRALLPRTASAKHALIARIRKTGRRDTILASHAVDEGAADALVSGDHARFLETRGAAIVAALEALGARLAGWGRDDRDRPSIEYLRRMADG